MILTVDDSRIIRRLVRAAAEAVGYEVCEAENGAEALERLAKEGEGIELVILDWNMPVMDGFECLQQMRSQAETQATPVMMLTTESQAERMAQALRAGANNYLTKPFTQEELIQKIMDTLGLG